MLQTKFPLFPTDVTPITADLAFKNENGTIIYFNFSMPVFTHPENDRNTFRMITSQFCVNGSATQSEIAKAFGVSLISVKRSVKLYREKGVKGFYMPRNTRSAVVLTGSVLATIQELLDDQQTPYDIAKKLNLKQNTIEKAIRAGRLHKSLKKKTIRKIR